MSWKKELQLRDLESHQRLEFTCRTCGHVHFGEVDKIKAMFPDGKHIYLDEVESRTKCPSIGCCGKVRLALIHRGRTSGFVGGLA